VVDGTDAEIISHILSNLIEQEKDPYKKILKKMMKEAILSIQAGDNPIDFILMVNSMANIKDDPITRLIADYYITGDKSAMDKAFHELAEKEFPFRESAEASEIIDFMNRAMMMIEAARRNGLQSLENLVIREKGSRDIFEYGISLVIDGYDYDFIKRLLDNLAAHETEPAMKTLAAIKKEAVLSIMAGDNTRITLMKLTSLYKGACSEL
jgi:flagellar motor component MotA